MVLKTRFSLSNVQSGGNDVYRWRVYRRFEGLCAMADELVFFNPKDRGVKRTRALWVTLTYDVKKLGVMWGWSLIGLWLMFVRSLARFHVAESGSLLRMVIHIFTVSFSLSQLVFLCSGIRRRDFVCTQKI